MPQPRKFQSNAERQKAYRLRLAGHGIHSSKDLREYERQPADPTEALVKRIMDADARARA